MPAQDQVRRAISDHVLWRRRVQAAITAGRSELSPDEVRQDNLCESGRWLYSPVITTDARRKPQYQACRQLHASFHREAARVLEYALAGQKQQALLAMGPSGRLDNASTMLITAMMAWLPEI